jgi:type I restriction enzyme S subunit
MADRYKAYPEYKNSVAEWSDFLPLNWQVMKVKFLLKDGSEGIKIGPFGSALKLEDMIETGIRVYGQENIIKRDFTLGKRFISQEKYSDMKVYTAKAGDILVTMMGTSGKCQVVPENAELGIIDSHLLKLRTNSKILPELFRLLVDEAQEIKDQIGKQGKGSIMHGLNSTIVKELDLPLPSIEEQVQILRFLDHETAKIDTLIAKQEKLIELLKEKRQAVISHTVTKGLNPNAPMKDSGVEWLGEVPEHWAVKKLKHFGIITGGFAFKSSDFIDAGYPVVKISNVSHLNIDWTDRSYLPDTYAIEHKDYIAPKGALVFAMTRPVISGGIKVFLMADDSAPLINQRVGFMNVEKQSDALFILQSSLSNSFLAQFTNNMTVTNQPNISGEGIGRISIPFPPESELFAINEALLKLEIIFNTLVLKCSNQIELLRERKTALISAAVTGKIDVRDWQPSSQQNGSQ